MLERASAIDPDYADMWLSLADRYYFDGHYGGGGRGALRRSEAAARQALSLDPNYMSAAVRLLSLQVEAGRLQDGYDGARQLVARHPDSGEAYFVLSHGPAIWRAAGGIRDRVRARGLARPDESFVPVMQPTADAARPVTSARLITLVSTAARTGRCWLRV